MTAMFHSQRVDERCKEAIALVEGCVGVDEPSEGGGHGMFLLQHSLGMIWRCLDGAFGEFQ